MAHVSLNAAALASPGAVAYACTRLGFRVFPLTPGSGLPAMRAWPQRATRDLALIRQWWTGEYAGHGVGIATGPDSGVWVLDVDVKGGAGGFASLRDLCAEHQTSPETLGATMIVATPSGGAHLYFRWDGAADADGGVRNSAKELAPGLDVRGIGGYVRAPGLGAYRIVERAGSLSTAIVSAPGWLVAKCKKRGDPSALRDATIASLSAKSADRTWALQRVDQIGSALASAPSGARNNELNRAAFRLGTLARSGAVDRDSAWLLCRDIMHDIGARDSKEAQLRTFESGWSAGLAAANGNGGRR